YVPLGEDDAMAVINAPQFLVGNPAPMITSIGVGLRPSAIVISPTSALVADLSLTTTAQPTTVGVGAPATITSNVTNNGPSNATGVTVVDNIPDSFTPGLTVASASQGTCSGTSPVTCVLGTLASGASASVTITVVA